MQTGTETESVYASLEPPVSTDAIEHWFELSGRSDTVEPHQGRALIKARAQLEQLVKQRDWLARELAAIREAHHGACATIVQMHEAAVGEVTPPIRGVVEDVQDLRARCLSAEEALDNALRPQLLLEQDKRGTGRSIPPPICGVALRSTDGRTYCELRPHGNAVNHESRQPDGQSRSWTDNESDG